MTSKIGTMMDQFFGKVSAGVPQTPSQTPMEEMHSPFYLQRDVVSGAYEGLTRLEIFAKHCAGKRVLHIGCTQYPITNIDNSLHIALGGKCSVIDGFDVDQAGYEILAPHISNGRFLTNIDDAGEYDVVIIPEVLEHVGDVNSFLKQMSGIRSSQFIITVPDVYQCMGRHFRAVQDGSVHRVAEAVHPDHNYWFTPFTLRNVVRKYTDWHLDSMYWINNISLMAICNTKRNV